MMSLRALMGRIDFVILVLVQDANPNGDPLNGNRPRETFAGYGELSAESIKRKIRNRLQDMGERIFVQSDDRADDGCKSLNDRVNATPALKGMVKGKNTDRDAFAKAACEQWIDVRSFGQVFAFKSKGKDEDEGKGVSVGVRGPVSLHTAVSASPIRIVSRQITKSVNGDSSEAGKSSDTMGMRHTVEFGMYVIKGSINCQLAEKTGFSEEDAEKIKEALCTLFENDASAARPAGSMEVARVYWWQHDSKTPKCSPAKVFRSVQIGLKDGVIEPKSFEDYDIELGELEGVEPEVIDLL